MSNGSKTRTLKGSLFEESQVVGSKGAKALISRFGGEICKVLGWVLNAFTLKV